MSTLFADGVKRAGGLPFYIPISNPDFAREYVNRIDKLILSGGQNVDPSYYGEEKTIDSKDYFLDRDIWEVALVKEAIAQGKPVLGVCRGLQLYNAVTVGSLNQAIDGWVAAARESGAGKAGDSGDGVAADDSATVLADGAAGSPNRDSDTPSGPRLLLIGKSLTTMTYPHVASHYGLPFVLLTPVLHHADFDPSARVIPVPAVGDDIVAESEAPSVAEARAIIRAEQAGQSHAASSRYSGPAPLICAGTADPFYDQARANALTPHVHEYPDANHSIEVPGHWRRSLDYLKEVTASVAQYAATL